MGKKWINILLLAVMVLTFSACGKKEANEAANSKEYVYRVDEVNLGEYYQDKTIWDFYILNERMLVTATTYTENGSEFYIRNMAMDATDPKDIKIDLTNEQYMNGFAPGADGNYYYMLSESYQDPNDPNGESWVNQIYLIALDQAGTELWRQQMGEDSSYYVSWFIPLKDGTFLVSDNQGITLYDATGKMQKVLLPISEKDLGINNGFEMEDGSIILQRYDYENSKSIMSKLDIGGGKLSGDMEIPDTIKNGSFYKGKGFDFYVTDSNAIYGYNYGDDLSTMLMNYIDSDLSATYLSKVCGVTKDEIYAKTVDSLTGSEVIMKFTKIPADQVADKKVLTLAGIYVSDDFRIRSAVVKFNKTSPDYRIRVKDYSQYNTDQDYNGGMSKLNTDIASGVVPDILVLSSEVSLNSYENKGVFEDLYSYMDSDGEIERKNYFENVFKAYENKGKLYRMPGSFFLSTVVGKASEVGTEQGWTLDEFKAYVDSKPEDARIFERMTRSDLLRNAMVLSGSQFVDWETGACNFNTPAFIYLLELAKGFPATWEEIDEEISREARADAYRNGEILLLNMFLGDFEGYNTTKKITFGEDITFIGFPTDNKKGSVIQSDYCYSISSKSKLKDGCWQFVRQLLLDDYQSTIDYGFPLSIKYAEKMAQEALKEKTQEDDKGNLIPYQEVYYNGEVEIPIPQITQQDVDEVMAFIKSVDQSYVNDQSLFNIIEEEAAPFFAGQKDVKAVVEIIQSRVQIYVNENR